MKILQLVTKRQYRGAEVFAANLSTELIKMGHEIIFAGLYKNDHDVLKVINADNRDLTVRKTGDFSLQLVLKIIRLVKETKPDVIQCNGSDTLKYMIGASFFIPKTPILYRNISMISVWVTGKPKIALYKRIFKRIDHVSSVGREAIDDFIQTLDYPRDQTSVIRRGIPVIKFDGVVARKNLIMELGLEEDDKIIMHIGNFSPEKNHHFLLDIFMKIKKETPKIKLICVGDGELFQEIKNEIKERDLTSSVYLLGFRKNISELLAASDCFALCSKVEGVPGVILEAATQCKPTVATNVGGVNEVLIDNETGYLINNFNKDEFALKLVSLVNNSDLRHKMGKNAYDLVMKHFNPLQNAKQFEDLYRDLINKTF